MAHNKVWYSVCSKHKTYSKFCQICRVGRWIDEADPRVIADNELWQADPDAWRKKHEGISILDELTERHE